MFVSLMVLNNWLQSNVGFILIPFELIFGISLAVFSFTFFYHRWLLKLEYKIKNKFNDLQLIISSNNFRYLESLAKNNIQLQTLLENANKSKNFFKNQLDTVKEKIIELSTINEKYKFKAAKELIHEIEKDLQSCEEMSKRLQYISSNSTEYSKNVSDLLTQYWNIVEETEKFYRFHLSTKYKNEVFKNMIQKISEHLSEAKEYVLKIDSNGLFNSLNGLNQHVWNFFDLVLQMYVLNRINTYIKMLLEQVGLGIKKNEKSLSTSEIIDIQKKLSLAANNHEHLTNNLKDIELKQAWAAATVAIKNLESAKVRVEQGFELNEIIKNGGNILHDSISMIVSNLKLIESSFRSMNENFGKKDIHSAQKICDLSNMLKSITLAYHVIISDMKSYETIERQTIIIKMKGLVEEILVWQEQTNILIKETIQKSNESLIIINEIADLRLTLNQILGMKNKFGNNDEITRNSTAKSLEIISQLETRLNDDYFESKKEVLMELRKIREQSIALMNTVFFDDSLRLYCQRMIMFLNKYRNEANEIAKNIDISERYFREKKYEDSLNILIETASIIKTSAKQNKMSLI